jgi:hypothetical protein
MGHEGHPLLQKLEQSSWLFYSQKLSHGTERRIDAYTGWIFKPRHQCSHLCCLYGWSFALKPGATFPTGNEKKDLGTGRVTYSIFFITTKEIEPLAFHLNLGYMRNENKLDERKDIWHISLASELKLIKDLRLVTNIGMERNPDRTSNKHPAFILGGFIYSIFENFDIDIGIKGGLNKQETDVTILAGIAWRF